MTKRLVIPTQVGIQFPAGPWIESGVTKRLVIPTQVGIQFLTGPRIDSGVTKLFGHSGVGRNPAWRVVLVQPFTEIAMRERSPFVYILASQRNGTLYVGVTSDLVKRIWEHRNDLAEGFTKKYGVHRLVFFEHTPRWKRPLRVKSG